MPMATGRPKRFLPADPYADAPRLEEDRSHQNEYEADCLAGRRFPNPGDTEMEQRCREQHRIREWFELFRRFHMATLARSTHYEGAIRREFGSLMDLKPSVLTRQAVQQWFIQIGQKSHIAANHAMTILRCLYNKMRFWGVYEGPNPTEGIKRYRLQSRARFVQPEEMPRILASMQEEPEDLQVLFLLCLLVGCRPGEALRMKWADVRFTEELARHQQPDGSYDERTEFVGIWHKPTTKNGLAHTIPIPPVLAARLHAIPRTSEWIFTGCAFHPLRRKPGPASYTMIHKHWVQVRNRAQIPDVRPYDLRRTCASWLAINGENAVLIAKVLNHTNLQCTGIYTRLNTAPVSRALNAHEDQVFGCAKKHVVPPDAFRETLHDSGIVDVPGERHKATEPGEMEWPG